MRSRATLSLPLALVGLLVGLAGCYQAALDTLPSGQLPCSDDGRCPAGFHCAPADHTCWRDGKDPGPAADGGGAVEMSVPDLARPAEEMGPADLRDTDGLDAAPIDARLDEGLPDLPPPDLAGCGFPGAACCQQGAACMSGCCSGGACVGGMAAAACGGAGQCSDCTGSNLGHACVSAACGCNLAADCPPGMACGPNHQCAIDCGVNTTRCNGGCCSGGKCVAGMDSLACGADGNQCADCSVGPDGTVCINGARCGCARSADCPPTTACNVNTGKCGVACAGNLVCNGGCCDGQRCTGGMGDANCGADGKACVDCKLVSAQCSVAGACDQCLVGHANCDNSAGNGCEVATATDPDHCGAGGPMNLGCVNASCSAVNVALRACTLGVCSGNCADGFADCNTDKLKDGCETGTFDPAHCGKGGATGVGGKAGLPGLGCGCVCSSANGTPGCAAGSCTITCAVGFGNCDGKVGDSCGGNQANGCEPTTSDPNNCGPGGANNAGCGVVCPGAAKNIPVPSCTNGVCDGACAKFFADCNGDKLSDGCEKNLGNDAANCGACKRACSGQNILGGVGLCTAGACDGPCVAGFGDCNNDKQIDGCEANLLTGSLTNCGACGMGCDTSHYAAACVGGTCSGACNIGFADCDTNLRANGCECDLAVSQCVGKACLKKDGQGCGVDGECASGGCCGGKCTNRAVDAANCGVCGKACGAFADACVGGVCQCGGGAACAAGQRCQGAACVCDNVSCAGCCTGKVCTGMPTAASCGSAGAACKDCNVGAPNGAPFADGCGGNGGCACGGGAPCPAGQTCQGGTCTCTAQSCLTGCCAGRACVAQSPSTCGAIGGMCSDCNLGAPAPVADSCSTQGVCQCGGAAACAAGLACVGGLCVCNPQSCAGGCCGLGGDGHQICNKPPAVTACGLNGVACKDCNAAFPAPVADGCLNGACSCGGFAPCVAGQTCAGGVCVCNALSCPSGCCQNNQCRPGNGQSACGAGGAACVDCTTVFVGLVCRGDGTCGCKSVTDCPRDANNIPQACDGANGQCGKACLVGLATGCNGGCCTAKNVCTLGNRDDSCGSSGQACFVCPLFKTCNGVTCL